MCGVDRARRGEARGEVKGDAVEDFVRTKAGEPAKAGGGILGEFCEGVGVRAVCQGAGEALRMIV